MRWYVRGRRRTSGENGMPEAHEAMALHTILYRKIARYSGEVSRTSNAAEVSKTVSVNLAGDVQHHTPKETNSAQVTSSIFLPPLFRTISVARVVGNPVEMLMCSTRCVGECLAARDSRFSFIFVHGLELALDVKKFGQRT